MSKISMKRISLPKLDPSSTKVRATPFTQSNLPRRNPSTKERNPLKSPLGKKQPSIIESIGTRPMISIRKENLKNPFHKHPANASTVERKVISRMSVEPKPSPLSTLSLVTNPAKMRSSSY